MVDHSEFDLEQMRSLTSAVAGMVDVVEGEDDLRPCWSVQFSRTIGSSGDFLLPIDHDFSEEGSAEIIKFIEQRHEVALGQMGLVYAISRRFPG